MQGRISFWRASLWILLSVFTISGTAFGIWRYYQYNKLERQRDPGYDLTNIVQAPREVLKPGLLEELFDLSTDQPTNCYLFDVEAARRKLLALPLVREGNVKVLPPHTVYVEYLLRTPVAYLGNFTNTLIDAEGVAFPAEPFFTPKRLPEFYLDLSDREGFARAMALVERFSGEPIRVKRVDLSEMNAASCGRREIVVTIECNGMDHLLRLDPDHWEEGVNKYCLLRDRLEGPAIVDLRLPRMALLRKWNQGVQ